MDVATVALGRALLTTLMAIGLLMLAVTVSEIWDREIFRQAFSDTLANGSEIQSPQPTQVAPPSAEPPSRIASTVPADARR